MFSKGLIHKFESLRMTVPKSAVVFMELDEGDFIEWQQKFVDGKKILIVTKVENKINDLPLLARLLVVGLGKAHLLIRL
jgi:hypothetical protein